MKIIKYYLTFCISSLLIMAALQFSACDNENDGQIMLRIENQSTYDFESIQVQWESDYQFAALKAGATSDYQMVENAYRYGYIKVMVGTDEFVLQPIDYIGEQYLDAGNYTYILNIPNFTSQNLSLEFRKD